MPSNEQKMICNKNDGAPEKQDNNQPPSSVIIMILMLWLRVWIELLYWITVMIYLGYQKKRVPRAAKREIVVMI